MLGPEHPQLCSFAFGIRTQESVSVVLIRVLLLESDAVLPLNPWDSA